ncbi:GNAT family N-acetyltransferase [Bacillus sp. JJ722]|uniref:GNAT family N-acetyltransferase n=1 Tax=Bacillus sp. JJ722 TaxID=3122973 RepID=UPI003000371D
MSHYQLISDYKDHEVYKKSFNELAKMVFQIDFKNWYEKGCWNDKYICYSYIDGDKVIANASISKMTIVSNGKEYNAIQVGTVMTHPDYRNQGLSTKLMNHIIEKYEKDYDFTYLFANKTVLDFYPTFGFEKVHESSYTMNISEVKRLPARSTLRRLDITNEKDYELIQRFAVERISVSSILGVINNESLLMFYLILVFNDAIYYLEEEDVIVIYNHEDNQLHLYDVISRKPVEIDYIINSIVTSETETINFYFTPDYDGKEIHTEFITDSDDTLFVRPSFLEKKKHFQFPLTSHS